MSQVALPFRIPVIDTHGGYLELGVCMYEFLVSGMTCGSCVKSITNAIKALDTSAQVNVDLSTQKIKVDSKKEQLEIQSSIEEAGYEILEAKKLS